MSNKRAILRQAEKGTLMDRRLRNKTLPRCPADGIFGRDFEDYNECVDCKYYDNCDERACSYYEEIN